MQKWNWKAQREKNAFLALADGTILRGYSVGASRDVLGEVVFNTGITGYQEILTDPSYHGQIVTMTYTEIGNTGMNPDDPESRGIYVNGFLVHEANVPSNWRARGSMQEQLTAAGVPALAGIDTRALTLKLRECGTLKGYLSVSGQVDEQAAVQKACEWEGLDGQDYAVRVTCKEPFEWDPDGAKSLSWGAAESLPEADLHIVALDFGIKWNILRRFRENGFRVTVVPAGTSAEEILRYRPDGVFLSNGPADPAGIGYAVKNIRDLIGRTPLMGICLGHQLLGLALGGQTCRLKFGHHGCNHPVMDLATRKVEITSQNHNFVVDMDSLPKGSVEITHMNLNDNTVEGLRHTSEPLFSLQYHPEAAPGPHDASYLFNRFRELIRKA